MGMPYGARDSGGRRYTMIGSSDRVIVTEAGSATLAVHT